MPNILLANHYDDQAFSILAATVPEGFSLTQLDEASKSDLINKIEGKDYLIASGRLPIDSDVLDAADSLKLVSRTGVGLDSIDLDALRDRNIALRVNQGVNAQSVAEHTLLLILASLRNLPNVDRITKSGKWLKRPLGLKTHELAGKTVFVVGLGNIGRKVIQLLSPFGCNIDGVDMIHDAKLPDRAYEADIITLHCPLNEDTRYLLDAECISRLKPGCIIVNTARGGLIDESSLADALRTGHIGFAALDVRETEPSNATSPFDGLENVILTPHLAGMTEECFASMMQGAMDNIVKYHEECHMTHEKDSAN